MYIYIYTYREREYTYRGRERERDIDTYNGLLQLLWQGFVNYDNKLSLIESRRAFMITIHLPMNTVSIGIDNLYPGVRPALA